LSVLLKDLPKEDLPRERLLSNGVESLSNTELIAILLRTGTKSVSAKDLADAILSKYKDITEMKYVSIQELESIKGMGFAKSTNLLAALELGRRVYDDAKIEPKIKINSSIDAYRYFAKYIINDRQENFMAIYLDNQNQYISHKILFKGTLNQSLVHPREVLKEALILNGIKIILMHNHPSGVLSPSISDDEVTRSIAESGNIMGIRVLDHIIVGDKDYYSYTEEGRIKYEE